MNENDVDQLFMACDSITRRALSCRTFGTKQNQQQFVGDDDITVLIQNEKNTEAWLERQIVDYRVRRSALERHANFRPYTSVDTHRLQGEVFDESVRIQQEHMLFNRIAMATPALDAIVPPSDDDPEPDKSQRVLLKHAIRERDNKATDVLDTSRTLERLKIEIQDAAEETQQVQEKNRALMNELQIQQKGQREASMLGGTSSADRTADESRMVKENIILRRALLDVIVEGNLEWYSDDRLRTTLLKLEHN
jgi:hypothetical protein